MMAPADRPLFTVIIATRNRPSLFAVALNAVLEQGFRDFEVVVVDDGSVDERQSQYRAQIEAAPGTVRMLTLPATAGGHGPSFARNYGVAEARGRYLCFLDDDDQWTDPGHLGRVADVIAANGEAVDLILANQRAFRNDTPITDAIWIEDLKDRLPCMPDAAGAYAVTATELLRCPAHCHLNTTIVPRRFYRALGGLDERLRYEEDRDFYLRAIDRATLIKYLPLTVSRHNIPDAAAATSQSTAESEMAKRLDQLRVFDKAILFSVRSELRRYAMRQRAYVLQHIAAEATRVGSVDSARYYTRQAWTAKLSGWTAAVFARAVAARRSQVFPQIGQITADQ
jgi:GT2 family glycosyltransferase